MRKIQGYAKAARPFFILLTIWLAWSCASPSKPLTPFEGTTSQWDASIDKHIPDAQRAAELKQLGRQLTELAKHMQQDIDAFNQKALALNEDYDATEAQAQQVIAEFTQQRDAAFARYRDLIFAMRGQASADEWKALTH